MAVQWPGGATPRWLGVSRGSVGVVAGRVVFRGVVVWFGRRWLGLWSRGARVATRDGMVALHHG
eukprot:4189605-Alexandrium_andersonii.AAC.1